MQKIERGKVYFFIGIGGIGMSGLAKIALEKGNRVLGSDTKSSKTTQDLEKLGATIYYTHESCHIKEGMSIIYSTGIPHDNVELKEAKRLNLPLLHRSDFLDFLAKESKPLLVTGTHGKTSTTALLSTLLMSSGLDPSFVVGGYVKHLDTNAHHGKGPYFVMEADESDGSFLKTKSFGAIITNAEEDHMDYWKTSERLKQGYLQFIDQVSHHLFLCEEDPFLQTVLNRGISYGFSSQADLRITRWESFDFHSTFDLEFLGKVYPHFSLPQPGRHQVLNATAAIGLALSLGISKEKIDEALKNYQGVKRRIDFIGEKNHIKVFDDYAHHPTEIVTTLKALHLAFPKNRLIVVFQPHRYTRLAHHLLDFSKAFSLADICLMTEVYSAGEVPISGVDTRALIDQMSHPHVAYCPKEEVITTLKNLSKPSDIIVTLGAGDITSYAPLFVQELETIS